MAGGDRSLTHCPCCGKEVDRLRAGAVGIYSGKMSYFCSRSCRDRFSSSGRDSGPRPAPAGPVPDPAIRAPEPELPASQPESDDMLPLLVPRRGPPAGSEPPAPPGRRPPESEPLPGAGVPVSVLEPGPGRGQLPRWLVSAGAGAAAITAVHVAVSSGWVDGSQGLALVLLVPAALLALVNALLEWRGSSVWRALDEVIVLGGVVIYAVPGLLALGRGDVTRFGSAAIVPTAVLVVVWSVRCVETVATAGLDRDTELRPVQSPGALAGLVGEPSEWGRSLAARLSGRLSLALTATALPVGLLVLILSALFSDRQLVLHHWEAAAAVVLSLSPRLLRNVLPAVMASALVRARREGIRFREDHAFEKAGRVSAVVLRKQGVVVEQGSEVVEFHVLGELPGETVLSLVASCEEIASGNEVAEALRRHARRQAVKPGDTRLARHLPSRGIHSTSPFGEIFVGNRLFLIENGISVGRGETVASEAEKNGQTAIFISVNRQIEAVAVLANRIRPTARQAVDSCHASGLTTVLITGDSIRTAESIGDSIGVDQVRSEVAVASRQQEVDRLRDTGHRLAVLGDLGRSAPRVDERTDVRIGLGWDGESLVDEAWDASVMGDDLVRAVGAIETARKGRRLVMLNWAIAVLAGGFTFGFAASGLASPIMAGLVVNLAAAVMMFVRPRTGSGS